jgi:hypothetical protein
MKIVIKTLQGKQLPLEVEETYTVSELLDLFSLWSLLIMFSKSDQTNQGKDRDRAQDAG